MDESAVAPSPLPAAWVPALAKIAAAVDISLFWETAVELLGELVPHRTAFMWFDYFDFGSSSKSSLVFEAPRRDRPPDYWGDRRKYHLTAQTLQSHSGWRFYRTSDVMPVAEYRQTEFYHRFMQPEGWEYGFTLAFWEGRDLSTAIALYRTEQQGDVTPEEILRIEAVYPILQATVLRLLKQHRRQLMQTSVEDFVRGLPVGLILLNWELEPVLVNDEGYRQAFYWLYGPRRPPRLHPRADFRVPPDLRQICENYRRSWLEQWTPGKVGRDAHIEHVQHPEHNGLLAHVSTQAVNGISTHRPSFLIRFSGLSSRSHEAFRPSEEQLKVLSQLTPAEREVAILLLQGLSNREIAARLHRERCTVKDHLSHIYSKLGIRNRTQLASLLSH